ncbi:Cmx/CmrA family chloramphenicol efflux MFS transporter [Kribbella deserti]|uniref:Cmx/CmrA family chloramphenicol efflux MFS transporter n=1 Tax=Kribbella deserti TaxID=1926257 RepID=A0ABV6QJW4_9ACTN
MPVQLYLLALAIFAMGTSEFMLAGLLPDLAADLDVSLGTAGLLTSAFAIGMVVGAPLMAALARNWPGRSSLLGFLALFLAAHVVGAIADGFVVLLVTRVVAALANAGFLAVALTTAAGLVPPDRKGRALAVLLSGTTIATIAGVPGGALLGSYLGWRATFWAVAILCVPAVLGLLRAIPVQRMDRPVLRGELAQLRRPRLIRVMLLGALVNAATFGTFTYLAPIVTAVAGLGTGWISVALVLFGLGSFAGVTAAGQLSDHRSGLVVAVGGPLLLLGWVSLALLADHPIVLLGLAFVQGALSFAVGSTLIARVLYEAAEAPTMAGSYATAALNVGAAAGPFIAGLTLTTRFAELGPVWVSSLLVVLALALASAGGLAVTERDPARAGG